jgi:acyl-CoA synthetase (AMP-forming)/AMP-acid ligase II
MWTEISDRLASCRRVDELLDHHARERYEKVSMQVGDVSVTYGELLQRVERLAAQLVHDGLEAGDRIAMLCKNDLAFCELMMAASRTGVVLVPLNFRLALPEIEFILQDSGARLLFAGTQFGDTAREVQANSATCTAVVEVTTDGLYGGWVQPSGNHSADVCNRDAILFQMYTSGTTGKPKGALISQKNVLALMDNGCRGLGPFHETSRSLVCMPLFHVAGELRANRRLESCGKPFADAEMKVVNPDGDEVSAGVVGEIICRTPQLMSGYWNRPDATAKAIRDDWYHTGDAGYVDEEGFLYIHDRIKDLVITGGENVYPAEVENAILAHPGVADVAVIGIPDARWGEIVLAAIVLREGQTVQADEVKSTVRARLAGFKVPKRIERVRALPRNGAGKVTKEPLRAQFAPDEEANPSRKNGTESPSV